MKNGNMEIVGVLDLNKLKSPSTKHELYQVWLKLAQWFGRRRFLYNFVNLFLLFYNYLHLDKGKALHLKKVEFTTPKYALSQVCMVKIDPAFLK